MIADIIKNIKEIGNQKDVQDALEPCVKYINDKIKTVLMFFQVIAILIICQILATLFLTINEIRRNAI